MSRSRSPEIRSSVARSRSRSPPIDYAPSSEKAIRLLLQMGVKLNEFDVIQGIRTGDVRIMKLLLEHGAPRRTDRIDRFVRRFPENGAKWIRLVRAYEDMLHKRVKALSSRISVHIGEDATHQISRYLFQWKRRKNASAK